MGPKLVRPEYISISDAVYLLKVGMFGGLKRPRSVRYVKAANPAISVDSLEWFEQAAGTLRSAALKGQLRVFGVSSQIQEIVPELLTRLVPVHRGLPTTAGRFARSPYNEPVP